MDSLHEFVAGFAAGFALALALLLGAGMVVWRWFWDGRLGHIWRDDWQETLKRWRSRGWTFR